MKKSFDMTLFKKDRDKAAVLFLAYLEGVVLENESHVWSNHRLPGVYKSGVVARTRVVTDLKKYQTEDLVHAFQTGFATADTLACWRVAALRRRGVAARVFVKCKEGTDGGARISVHMLYPNGHLEEPFKRARRDAFSSDEMWPLFEEGS